MKKRKWKILVVIGCILLMISAGLIFGLSDVVVKSGKRQTLEEAFAWQSDHYDTSFYEKTKKMTYEVEGEGGYTLHAELLVNPEPSTKYIILSHGHTDNRMGSLKYVPIYFRQGYNCVIYDLRGHGENKPDITTYGIREAADLNCMIEDTRKRYPELTMLGLHGESLGAGTTITCLKYNPQVDFAVSDCAFADIENVLRGITKKSHYPSFAVNLADIGTRLRYGYSLKKMRPIDSLAENRIPVLFIHGEEDDFILPENAKRMAGETRGMCRLVIVPGAKHAESVLKDPVRYEEAVDAFLKEL